MNRYSHEYESGLLGRRDRWKGEKGMRVVGGVGWEQLKWETAFRQMPRLNPEPFSYDRLVANSSLGMRLFGFFFVPYPAIEFLSIFRGHLYRPGRSTHRLLRDPANSSHTSNQT